MSSGPSAYITHPACIMHSMGKGHPECAERLEAIKDRLMAAGIWDFLLHIEAPAATREQLARVHGFVSVSLTHLDVYKRQG